MTLPTDVVAGQTGAIADFNEAFAAINQLVTAAAAEVSHPNDDDVLVTIDGVDVFYDSGWRDVSGALINGWTGGLYCRKTLDTVYYRGTLNSASITAYEAFVTSTLFPAHQFEAGVRQQSWTTSPAGFIPVIEGGGNMTVQQTGGAATVYLTWTGPGPAFVVPTSLPGTAVEL